MSLVSIAPVLVLSAACYLMLVITRRSHPTSAVRVLLLLASASAVAFVAVVCVVAGAYLVQIAPFVTTGGHLANLLAEHGPVPPVLGMGTTGLLFAIFATVASTLRRAVREQRSIPRQAGVVVIDGPEMAAWASSGRRSSILLSRGMVDGLSDRELAVVLSHESSHIRNHHSRYALAASMAACAAPWLLPIRHRIRFLIERWADEDAASVVGDRELVARAISRVALAGQPSRASLGFADGDVVARVKAMLEPAPQRALVTEKIAFAGTTAAASGMAGSSLQLHHAFVHLV